ncbi:MAG: hypothetical protein ACPGZT_01680 [Luminiphilus sp.]
MRLLDCNDAALRLWQDGEGIWSPGITWFAGGQYQFGEPAWQRARLSPREINNRFWHRLSTQPLSPALGPARHTADLVHTHLQTLLGDVPGDVRLAIPGTMEPAQLSLLLGILQTLPVTARSVIHRSALIGSAVGEACAHVELHLHQASITGVSVTDGIATAQETQLLPGQGLLGLMDEIAERIGEQFVSQTRFDPQRRAETEQALYQQIPALLGSLVTQSEISCTVEGHTARIAREALAPVGAAFSRALAPLLPAGVERIALDALLSELPGLTSSGEHISVSAEIIPRAADVLEVTEGELIFQREAPCSELVAPGNPPGIAAQEDAPVAEADSGHTASAAAVTHQLIAGHATPLTLGSSVTDGVVLSGVNELTVTTEAAVTLNGRSVEGVTAISAGDRLTVAGVDVDFIVVEV